MRDGDGAVRWLAAFVVDITARKREEERTRVLARLGAILNEVTGSKERLRRLVDAVVPALADRCSAALLRADGQLVRVAERTADDLAPDAGLASAITVPLRRPRPDARRARAGSRHPGAFEDDADFARDLARPRRARRSTTPACTSSSAGRATGRSASTRWPPRSPTR